MPKLMPFSAVKPDAWPPQFRRLLDLRHAQSGPLELPSVASGWRETTFNLHLWNVGYFVGWLKWSGRFQDTTDLYEYATPEIIGAYVDDMRGFALSTRTIATRVDGVRAALTALSPSYPTDWLMHGINKLRARTFGPPSHPSKIPAHGPTGRVGHGPDEPGLSPRLQPTRCYEGNLVSRRPDDRFPGVGGAETVTPQCDGPRTASRGARRRVQDQLVGAGDEGGQSLRRPT